MNSLENGLEEDYNSLFLRAETNECIAMVMFYCDSRTMPQQQKKDTCRLPSTRDIQE